MLLTISQITVLVEALQLHEQNELVIATAPLALTRTTAGLEPVSKSHKSTIAPQHSPISVKTLAG